MPLDSVLKSIKPRIIDTSGQTNNSNGNGARIMRPKRRATAQSMAASQRDISVSEFFAKNRHLLGFDNPRKALLDHRQGGGRQRPGRLRRGRHPARNLGPHPTHSARTATRSACRTTGRASSRRQIPLIFGKLLYGSKFHRLRMSRGQQGIGISAAGMHGLLTTGKPVKIMSKVSSRDPAHYYEIQIDTKRNLPEILNGRGEGVEIPPNDAGRQSRSRSTASSGSTSDHGTRVTIELEARYQRGRGSVDDYLEQTAIANPHVAIHYTDPDDNQKDYARVTEQLPPEPKEIKPHPYGVELGRLVAMLKETKAPTIAQFLVHSFSRVSPDVARRMCDGGEDQHPGEPEEDRPPRGRPALSGDPADEDSRPGDRLHRADRRGVDPQGLAAGGAGRVLRRRHAAARPSIAATRSRSRSGWPTAAASSAHRVSREALAELLEESDARTLRQFLITTFQGLGADAADKILAEANVGTRVSPGRLKPADIDRLHQALQNVNLSEGQSMNVLRYANRVPLQFQAGACAITQTVMATNWRAYGLSQSRGSLPSGPVTVMVHMASVWVPFTNESKEAIASYPEIQKELRLALQAVGRKLGMFLRRRLRVRHEGERRNLFLRYVGEVATAVSRINDADRDKLYDQLLEVAKKRTAEADVELDDRGQADRRRRRRFRRERAYRGAFRCTVRLV